ncbi:MULTISPECIES: MurR/RpiR family transcriptional regulator [Asticcacaulis]|uniref:MurR/RpiR family transcriptional regulator n=1 Tax=Asticcacaulis TaxID=76890 RepID=UPI001FD9EDD6|nr:MULTISPECIES: MurR/RpiR family transcriptional regulator [Asticcacaulis]MBP2159155.1 DNA-binding MurR/RpiR family transcriptional regulator [Asticcacaulis solisilvae]MDR6800200.1 DNA-binding MurR/RpiR family transcriptional regulator [Asticcacaulis sp. BE141]
MSADMLGEDGDPDTTVEAPDTLETLRSTIVQVYEDLSRRMKQVATFVLDKPEDVAFETLAVIAERADVQPSAIVRFAKILGYPGASQMQKVIRDELLANHMTLAYGERARQFTAASGEADGATDNILGEYVEADLVSLNHLRQSISAAQIREANAAIAQASTVYIAGFRRAFPPASYLAYALQRAGKRTCFIDGTGGLWANQIRGIQPDDLLIAISFRPYAEETVKCHAIALERGAPILSITDSNVSPLVKGSGQVLLVRDAEVRSFRSLTATLCLVQSLVISYAFASQEHDN